MEKPTGTQQSEAGMSRSYVVTGGSRGIGRAVVERLLSSANTVVVIEFDQAALAWTRDHPASPRVKAVVGDAADEKVTERAADLAMASGTLTGWVNNAAICWRTHGAGPGCSESQSCRGWVRDRDPPLPGDRNARGNC